MLCEFETAWKGRIGIMTIFLHILFQSLTGWMEENVDLYQ